MESHINKCGNNQIISLKKNKIQKNNVKLEELKKSILILKNDILENQDCFEKNKLNCNGKILLIKDQYNSDTKKLQNLLKELDLNLQIQKNEIQNKYSNTNTNYIKKNNEIYIKKEIINTNISECNKTILELEERKKDIIGC